MSVRALRRVADKGTFIEISDTETVFAGGVDVQTPGAVALYPSATTIVIGGGGGNTLTEVKSTENLVLSGYGADTPLNQVGQESLSASFSGVGRGSIVAALNGIADGSVSVPAGLPKRTLIASTAGQTVFLSDVDLSAPFRMYVNGVSYPPDIGNYTVSGVGNRTFTWHEIGAAGPMEEGAQVELEGY